jgi:hypothetical protein
VERKGGRERVLKINSPYDDISSSRYEKFQYSSPSYTGFILCRRHTQGISLAFSTHMLQVSFFCCWIMDCWLEVSIRKVLRPANTAQVFLSFPVSKKQMLRWFPRFQVATTCFSCGPPEVNLAAIVYM